MWLSGRLPCMVVSGVSGQSGCHPGCSWLPRGQNWKQPLSWGWARTWRRSLLPLVLVEESWVGGGTPPLLGARAVGSEVPPIPGAQTLWPLGCCSPGLSLPLFPISWAPCLPLSLQEPPGSHMELQTYHAMTSGVENSVENAFPSLKARLLALGELP